MDVLVVEADTELLGRLLEVVRALGHFGVGCADAATAWDLCRGADFQVFIVDGSLPNGIGPLLDRKPAQLSGGE